MFKLLYFLLKLALAAFLIMFVTVSIILRFQHPDWTETQLLVRSFQTFIP
jgi:hypothetical protein